MTDPTKLHGRWSGEFGREFGPPDGEPFDDDGVFRGCLEESLAFALCEHPAILDAKVTVLDGTLETSGHRHDLSVRIVVRECADKVFAKSVSLVRGMLQDFLNPPYHVYGPSSKLRLVLFVSRPGKRGLADEVMQRFGWVPEV
jgi:hypothetical protein